MCTFHRALSCICQNEAAFSGDTTGTWEEEHHTSLSFPLFLQEEHTDEILISLEGKKKHLTYSFIFFFFNHTVIL